jgi:hypothetical protein
VIREMRIKCDFTCHLLVMGMVEGTIKAPIPKCRLYWCFCLGWCSKFVGSESGQKESVKLLKNMVYNSTPTPLPTATNCLYILYVYCGKGGGQREGRGATVHKYNSFVHGGNSSQAGSRIPTMSECISSL